MVLSNTLTVTGLIQESNCYYLVHKNQVTRIGGHEIRAIRPQLL